ncbi:MAG TPA: hypothetical protein VM716_15895 [Gemmatimonadales bacterium]|nr:hypothetical protein [Gemmatimonadales bacterium]
MDGVGVLLAMVLRLPVTGAGQTGPLEGTWELTRIFRSGPTAAAQATPIDSTVYIRIMLETHAGGWISGRMYRRYHGAAERSKVEGGPLGRGSGRYILGVELERPAATRARTAAWLVGETVRLGTSLVPDADSLEFRRVAADAPYPATVAEVVTVP